MALVLVGPTTAKRLYKETVAALDKEMKMKNLITIFALMTALSATAFASEKTLVCGGSKPDTMGATLYIKLFKQENKKYGVILERTTYKNTASINKQILQDLTCEFSKVDNRVVICLGGTRREPQYFSIKFVSEISMYGQLSSFVVRAQADELRAINQRELHILGIFNDAEETYSPVLNVTLSDDYGCTY